jgi:hypothetical protein
MNEFLLLIHGFLTLVKSYYLVPLLVVAGFVTAFSLSIRNAAWSDIRNMGTGFVETGRLAQLIFLERRAKRDLLTMIYCYELPPIIVLWVLAMFWG